MSAFKREIKARKKGVRETTLVVEEVYGGRWVKPQRYEIQGHKLIIVPKRHNPFDPGPSTEESEMTMTGKRALADTG